MVSNGRDVVLTDTQGRWRIPVRAGDSLFVVKPPHWSTPLGAGGVPRFSRLHQPLGSPCDIAYRHAGIAPTGALPASIDFPLIPTPERPRFEVLLLADTQPADGAELAYLRDDIVAGTLGWGAAFGINHGDVVFDDLSLYPRYLQVLGASGIAWHHCPGNHDVNLESPNDECSRETWKRVFGPRHYAFQYADVTFIMLDNVRYLGNNSAAAGGGGYIGLIGVQQLRFMRNVLANIPPEQLVVVSMHIPLVTYQDGMNAANNTRDRNDLLAVLSKRRHTVSFSGHMHATEHHYLGADEGFAQSSAHHHHVLTAASGAWWGGPKDARGIPSADSPDGSPNGFHILGIDGNYYTTRYVPAVGKATGQIRVLVNDALRRTPCRGGAIPPGDLPACELIANVFDGGPSTRVTYEIGSGNRPPSPMQRTAISDPYITALFAETASAQKPWVRPVPSSHLWKAPLPVGLEPGAHCVTVRAVNEYGRELSAHLVLEIADRGAPT
jgi:hypothetical protein